MYEEGYHSITNIDLCMTVIKAMQEKYRDKPGCLTAVRQLVAMTRHVERKVHVAKRPRDNRYHTHTIQGNLQGTA